MAKEKEVKKEIGTLRMRADFDPKTIDKETRSVDVIFATDKPIRIRNWDWEIVDEILSMDPAHVRLDRMRAGAPLLNNHDRYNGVLGQLGVTEVVALDKHSARATVRFSKRKDVDDIWNDVVDGIIKGISAGYRVYEYEITEKDGQIPQYRAVDWEPFEISLAPIPADFTASVRSQDGKDDKNLNEVKIRSLDSEGKPKDTETEKKRTMPLTPEEIEAKRKADEAAEKTRKDNEELARKQGIESERKRSLDINTAVTAAKLPADFARKLIDDGTTIDKARELIIEEFAKNDPAAGANGNQNTDKVRADEADKRRAGMSEAIEHRAKPGDAEIAKKMVGSEYRGMSLLRMAEVAIRAAGGDIKGLTDHEIAKRALNLEGLGMRSGGMMSTSDFPLILGNTVNRRLLAEYALAPRTFLPWTTRGTAKDFRQLTRTRLGDATGFQEVKEGSEYKAGSLGEGAESYRLAKYGEIIPITWEALVNDDLDAFSRLPTKLANAAVRKQSDIVYGILTANAAMSDGIALFHASHGNLGTAGAIAVASLGEARAKMRKQKGLGDLDFINLTPSFLVVGPDYEGIALQYTSPDFVPNSQGQINPFKNLAVIVEPRLTGNQWYVMASPGAIDNVEYAFLEGNGELYTETRQGFEVDGLEIKARMVFAAKAIDWKGMVKNAGA